MPSNKPEFFETLLLKGGTVVDPSSNRNEKADIIVDGDTIRQVGTIDASSFSGKVIDCTGKTIIPGLMDMHVHLREPGEEHKETVESGLRAAMNGGFTAVCSMPNTKPAIDSLSQIELLRKLSGGMLTDLHPIAAVTKGREGKELTEMGELAAAGAVGFSDDGSPVLNSGLMRNAMEYAAMVGRCVIDHCEDPDLAGGGHMNESLQSTYAGLKAIPSISEAVQVARDVLISEYTGCPVHIAHVSTEESVRIIRNAKARKIAVTAETCPHYLVLTDEAVRTYDTNYKMNPPLRSAKDQAALIAGLKDGTIDVIASDHAPHHADDKDLEFSAAAFGIVGLETSLGIVLTELMGNHQFSLVQIIELMSANPRRITRVPAISIQQDQTASLTILDLGMKWTVDSAAFMSRSVNTPFNGRELSGGAWGVVNNHQVFVK
ncbi:dihydroorotase [bacterium]|nr:dihydroorotase [bacterium]